MRSALKTVAETALLKGGIAALWRRRFRDRTLILAYHNIVPDNLTPSGDQSLHITRSSFAAQLDLLGQFANVIPLHEVFQTTRRSPGPHVAITFDDAYRGTVTVGVPELVRRRLPATIFVPPAFIGDKSFWWDCIRERERTMLSASVRTDALSQCQGKDSRIRAWAAAKELIIDEPGPFLRAASEDELQEASSRHPGLSFGSHTWSHANLAAIPPSELKEEFVRAQEWLQGRFKHLTDWVSYPYGLTSEEASRTARAVGHPVALLVSGGWIPRHAGDTTRVPRLNIPAGLSARGFVIRLSGLLPG